VAASRLRFGGLSTFCDLGADVDGLKPALALGAWPLEVDSVLPNLDLTVPRAEKPLNRTSRIPESHFRLEIPLIGVTLVREGGLLADEMHLIKAKTLLCERRNGYDLS